MKHIGSMQTNLFLLSPQMMQVRRDNGSNEAKTPEENSNALSSLGDFDVTRLSEEEMSTLRDVLERQWVMQERNAEEKRCGLFSY